MSDLPFHRRDLLKTGSITLAGATGLGQSVAAQHPSGLDGDPTEIRDWNDLNAVRQNLDGDYVVVNDLDQTTAGYDEHVGNPEKGWNPIGDVDREAVEFTSFTGTVDGNGHTITGLQIDRPEETDIGLFAMIANRSTTITDLVLTELDVTGREFVGGLVGSTVSATLTRSWANGEVTGETFVGGLVGKNAGTVRKSSFQGHVTGEESVGGLVGWNVEGASVSESWVRGDVTGGGIVGGLVGTMTDDGGVVRESWLSGNVTGEYDVGGVIGYNKDSEGDPVGELTALYWNTEISEQTDAVGTNEGRVPDVTGLSTGEMTGDVARETMAALDFEATWQVVTNPDGYPVLQWQDGVPVGERDDREEEPPAELTVESVEMVGTVLEPIPVTVELTPANTVEQVVVEVAAADGVGASARQEIELEERGDGRFEGELAGYSAVGTLDATVGITISENTELSVGEPVVVRPKAFTTEEYLGYQIGRGYIEDSDLELLAEIIAEEGIDQAFETGTKAAVQALAQKAGLGSAQAVAAGAIAGKLVVVGLTVGSFVPDAGVATETKAFVYPEAEGEAESLSIADSLTVTAGTSVFPLIEVTQGDLFSDSLLYSVEDTTTDVAISRVVPFGEAHRPARQHKALILPFDELAFPDENGLPGDYELESSYGGINRAARITVERAPEEGDGDTEELPAPFPELVKNIERVVGPLF